MKVLVIGANGQLGSEFPAAWPEAEVIGLTRADLDVTDAVAVPRVIGDLRPDVVINTAAYHKVEVCERDPETSFRVNATAARNVASAAQAAGAAVVYISTDYVFPGDSGHPYVEGDARRPVNVYGVSKAAGEDLVARACERHYIIRSSGLYGVRGASGKGGNFIETILKRAAETGRLQVVTDQTLSPTFTHDLARAIRTVVQEGQPGRYHITNQGAVTWFDFASMAVGFAGLAGRTTIEPIASNTWDQVLQRPAYSVLKNASLESQGIPLLRSIDEALAAYVGMRAA
ncbi:MAG: dTDP-4-dehydrorhamnose reductase [Dehalococcoidia bacterium]